MSGESVCPECQSLEIWVLGTVAGELYLACQGGDECGHMWTVAEPLGPAFDEDQPTLFGTVSSPSGSAFDADEGDRRRDEGIARAAAGHPAILWFAKAIAVHIGRRGGLVCADDVQAELIRQDHQPEDLGNAAGAIFKDRTVWKWNGTVRNSTRIARQSGVLREWIRIDLGELAEENLELDDGDEESPAWTQEDLDTLDRALATGWTGPLRFADQTVEFAELSGDELLELRARIEHGISDDSNPVTKSDADVISADLRRDVPPSSEQDSPMRSP